MNSKIKNVIFQNILFYKNELFFVLASIVLSLTIINFASMNESFSTFILLLLLSFNCYIASLLSLLPSTKNASFKFSWKYLQGLPLSKKELAHSLILNGVIASIPMFLCLILFWSKYSKIFHLEEVNPIKFLVNLFLFILLYSVAKINMIIGFPRKEHQSKTDKNKFIRLVRYLVVFMLASVTFVQVVYLLDTIFNMQSWQLIAHITKTVCDIVFLSWWSAPIIIGITLYYYFRIFKIWTDEKVSYSKSYWSSKKEFSVIGLSCVYMYSVMYFVDVNTPDNYKGKVTELVFQKNYKQLDGVLNANNVNLPNSFGFKPIFVAVREGDIKMVKFLESKGATIEGAVNKIKSNKDGYNTLMLAIDAKEIKMAEYILQKKINVNEANLVTGNYPLHLAASKCKAGLVDLLIKNGSNVNSLNKEGETPLNVAAKFGCFSTAVSLKEAGADFNIADAKGKLPLDKLDTADSYNKEFNYFLEKNTRKPASVN